MPLSDDNVCSEQTAFIPQGYISLPSPGEVRRVSLGKDCISATTWLVLLDLLAKYGSTITIVERQRLYAIQQLLLSRLSGGLRMVPRPEPDIHVHATDRRYHTEAGAIPDLIIEGKHEVAFSQAFGPLNETLARVHK